MDKDIINTIEDCIEKAKHPTNIVFGICLQHDPQNDFLVQYNNNPQFKIHRMHWNKAKGPTFARYYCFKMISDEEYFLQIDCHTRFFNNWDQLIIQQLHKCEKVNPKAVISHYPINIKDMNDPIKKQHIGHIKTFRYVNTDSIKSHGSLQKLPSEPVKSWGIMAAMMFMRTKTIRAVPYDVKTYFGYHAEEQFYYAVRLWTNGYDCFTPSVHILAMEYITNSNRIPSYVKSHLAVGASKWNKKTWNKCKYYLKLDSLENIDSYEYKEDVLKNQTLYGLGNERNVIDYYKMTGLHDKLLRLFPFYKEYCKIKFHNNNFNHLLEIHKPSKNIAVVTQNTPNLIHEYFINTRNNHIAYCDKYNYTYYCFYENLAEEVKKGESPKICWSKVIAILNMIKNHDYIMWIDADAIFANQNTSIQDKINISPDKHFFLSKDPKSWYINSGVMIWKNTDISIDILNKWWNMNHSSYGKGGDQSQLCSLLRNKKYDNYWYHFEERELNCYPTNYKSYDYIIHYMGSKSKININNRVSEINKLIKYENDNKEIIVSIATIPHRYNYLPALIDNLLNSTTKPDKIVFQIPKRYNLFFCTNHVQKLKDICKAHIESKLVYINILEEDYGPSNKYEGMFIYYDKFNLINSNFVFIVLDDDLIYHNYIIEELLNKHNIHQRSIISGYKCYSEYGNAVKITANKTKQINIIKGGNALLIPKYVFSINSNPSFNDVLTNIKNDELVCDAIYNDDHLITCYLYFKNHEIKSIYDIILKKGNGTSYTYNPLYNNKDIGVSHRENTMYNKVHISNVVAEFFKYFDFRKYSNVEFNYKT